MGPETAAPVGSLQVILAIGINEQINYLKKHRNLSPCRDFQIYSPKVLPATAASPPHNEITAVAATLDADANDKTVSMNNNRSKELSSMLNNFIENLATRLPDCNRNSERSGTLSQASELSTDAQQRPPGAIRATSDLLDELQRALTVSPAAFFGANPSRPPAHPATIQSSLHPIREPVKVPHFLVLIEIENALHLSMILVRMNKKRGKRGRDPAPHANAPRGGIVKEIEPSTYVTFEAFGPPTSVVNSNEGPVYTTNVADSSCSPQWNKRFEVYLPTDLLFDVSVRSGSPQSNLPFSTHFPRIFSGQQAVRAARLAEDVQRDPPSASTAESNRRR